MEVNVSNSVRRKPRPGLWNAQADPGLLLAEGLVTEISAEFVRHYNDPARGKSNIARL